MMCYDLSIRYDDVLDLFQYFSSLKLTSKYGGISTTKLLGEDMRSRRRDSNRKEHEHSSPYQDKSTYVDDETICW